MRRGIVMWCKQNANVSITWETCDCYRSCEKDLYCNVIHVGFTFIPSICWLDPFFCFEFVKMLFSFTIYICVYKREKEATDGFICRLDMEIFYGARKQHLTIIQWYALFFHLPQNIFSLHYLHLLISYNNSLHISKNTKKYQMTLSVISFQNSCIIKGHMIIESIHFHW